jgi:hypothetical protein
MSKAASDLTARIKRLEAAEQRAKAFGPKETVTFQPMRELINVTRPTLAGWCNEIEGFEDSGCFVRGGNGIEWAFNPRKTVAYLLKHFRAVAAGQAAKSRKLTKAVGVTLSDGDEAMSMAEVKDRLGLTLALVAATEKQGGYVPAVEVSDFIAEYNQAVIDGIMGVATLTDPQGNLPPAVRKSIDEFLRSLALAVQQKAQRAIETFNAGAEPIRTGRTGRATGRTQVLPKRRDAGCGSSRPAATPG